MRRKGAGEHRKITASLAKRTFVARRTELTPAAVAVAISDDDRYVITSISNPVVRDLVNNPVRFSSQWLTQWTTWLHPIIGKTFNRVNVGSK